MKSTILPTKCPLRLTEYPTSPCQVAIKTLEGSDGSMCDWAVPNADSHYCFWNLLWRESPVTDVKEIAQLLGITKSEAESAMVSAIRKLSALDKETDEVQLLWGLIEQSIPIDGLVYHQLFDTEETMDPNKYQRSSDCKEDLDAINSSLKKPKRQTLKHQTTGFSGAGAVHKSGNKTQLFGLSENWYKNAKKFDEMGTPIRIAQYTLQRKKDKDEEEVDSKE